MRPNHLFAEDFQLSIRRYLIDGRIDINPKSWLSRYRRTSPVYLTIMLLFYHGLGFLLLIVGTEILSQINPEYEEPSISRSLLPVLTAGPIEETIFYGIPFYLSGNPYLVLSTGAIWAASHLLNTTTLDLNRLAFANLLFVIPSVFYSLRTWISGKGWFAVLAHSAWNGVLFSAGCVSGEFACSVYEDGGNGLVSAATSIMMSAILLIITYLLYKKRSAKLRTGGFSSAPPVDGTL